MRSSGLFIIFSMVISLAYQSNQSSITLSTSRTNKHMLAVISEDDPSSIEIVPDGIAWLKSLKEPISFVFQFKAGEDNEVDKKNYGLISEASNISESDSAGFLVEKIYVNFNNNDPMRTWKLYAIPALIASSYMIERGNRFKGAPKAMQIFNMLRQSLLLGGELNRTKALDIETLRFPSIFWIDETSNELKYLTSSRVDSLLSNKVAIDLPEYFDSKAEEFDMQVVKSRIFRLARPKKLASEVMTGDQIAELIKFLVRYLNSERYPIQLETAFLQIYKRNYCQLEHDEKYADRLSRLNEQLESPSITEFQQNSERVRKQIEKLMCPKFDPKKWCNSQELYV